MRAARESVGASRGDRAVCWDVLLAALRWPEVDGVEVVPATLELVRARAPQVVISGATLDFRTLTPERGGLFDYRVFGAGTVIDAPLVIDDSAAKPRNVTFGRLVLARPIAHPLLAPPDPAHRHAQLAALDARGLVLRELAVLPPDLRPLQRLADDRWQSTSLNDLYRRVITRNDRLAKLIASAAPDILIDAEEIAVHEALLALFHNEHLATPVLDALHQPLGSLQYLAGDIAAGLHAFAAAAQTPRARAIEAVALALGFELRRSAL
jgi:DNA-directed RNA polymerase beta' subunit